MRGPHGAAACRAGAAPLLPDLFPLERIGEIEATVKRDVNAFLTACNKVIGEPGRFLHMSMTSCDVLDTALAVQLKDAGLLILAALDGVLATLERRSHTICMRRSRVRIARAIDEVAVGKLSGAVGAFAHLDPAVEDHVCRALGLTAAPASNQVVQRDRQAHYFQCLALLATSIETVAVEVRHLQRSEVLEAMDAFTVGQAVQAGLSAAFQGKDGKARWQCAVAHVRQAVSNPLAARQDPP